jgi:predicted PurR-regulated permease PerM
MYIIILIIYWLSSIGIGNKTVSDSSKDLITFTFVPVNTIITLPYLIHSFEKKKNNEITMEQLNKRTIMVLIIAVILMIFEFFYFRNIQKGIIELVEQKQSNEVETIEENLENNIENTENNQESIIDDINNTENVIENLY